MSVDRATPLGALPQWLRPEEAATHLGISRGLVYEMCRRGDLPCTRFGRLLRINRDGLAAMAAGQTEARDAD